MSIDTATAASPSYKKVIKVTDLPKLTELKNHARSLMINRILDLLMPATGRTAWKTTNAQLIKRLTGTPDLAYLERVLDLAVLAGTNDKTADKNRKFITTEASSGQRHNINMVHANREFLPQQDHEMNQLASFVGELRLGYKSTDTIPTLAAHMTAKKNYGFIGTNDEDVLFGCYGYGTTHLSQLIEKRPSMVKLILDYRDMVGTTDVTETGFRVFAAKHTGFTPEQQHAIWQSRSNRAYNNGTVLYRRFPGAVISRSEWEAVQGREEIMTLR
jgi:hypothetical protein